MFVLGCPLYNSHLFIDNYLGSILRLDWPKSDIHLKFLITRSNDNTETSVRDYVKMYGSQYASVEIILRDVIKEGDNDFHSKIINVSDCWSTLAKLSKPHDLMVIEHDNTCPPDTIKRLKKMVDTGADMCSGITVMMGGQATYKLHDGTALRLSGLPTFSAYAMGHSEDGQELGVLQIGKHTPSLQVIFLPLEMVHKIIRVGAIATGMVYIKRWLLDAVPFKCAPNSSQDIEFCKQTYLLGAKMYVDTDLWYDHHHYSYISWCDKVGRRVIYSRGQSFDYLKDAGEKLPLECTLAMVVPKEEVERQDVPHKELQVYKVLWEPED